MVFLSNSALELEKNFETALRFSFGLGIRLRLVFLKMPEGFEIAPSQVSQDLEKIFEKVPTDCNLRHALAKISWDPPKTSFERQKVWTFSRYLIIKELAEHAFNPAIALSVSHHAHTVALAFEMGSKIDLQIGIDIEKEKRTLSKKLCQRLTRPTERDYALEPIEFWAIKEACYKADSLGIQKPLSHYEIVDFSNGQGFVKKQGSSTLFQFLIAHHEHHVVALAINAQLALN